MTKLQAKESAEILNLMNGAADIEIVASNSPCGFAVTAVDVRWGNRLTYATEGDLRTLLNAFSLRPAS